MNYIAEEYADAWKQGLKEKQMYGEMTAETAERLETADQNLQHLRKRNKLYAKSCKADTGEVLFPVWE